MRNSVLFTAQLVVFMFVLTVVGHTVGGVV